MLNAETTAIVLDSTADFPEAQERYPNWRVVPLYVLFGTESFRDGVDLSPQDFYARLPGAAVLPTTSQPTPQDFLAAYATLSQYERIYSLHISGALSGTVDSARKAAAELGDDRVRVIDTGTASAAITMLGFAIQRRLEAGTTDEEVDALLARYHERANLLFTVDTLTFLQRGGRIGRAQAMAGQLLNVKPILTIKEEVIPVKRVRGTQKAMAEFASAFVSSTSDGAGLRVGIATAAAPEREQLALAMVRRERPHAQVEIVTSLGAVVGTHAGPGTLGLFWYEDPS